MKWIKVPEVVGYKKASDTEYQFHVWVAHGQRQSVSSHNAVEPLSGGVHMLSKNVGGRMMDSWYATVSSQSHKKDFKDPNAFISQLTGAINDEASAVQFYDVLEEMAPSQYRDFVTHAKNDEIVHVRLFSKLYRRLMGHESSVKVETTKFSSYKEGLEIAFRRELEAVELYRDMYLSTRVPEIRDILFKTMTDEMEHAQRFNFLYTVSQKS